MAIPVEDPIYRFAEHAGISADMLSLCWSVFKNYYADGNGSAKRQKDWRAHYRTAVKSNWYKLWYMSEGKVYRDFKRPFWPVINVSPSRRIVNCHQTREGWVTISLFRACFEVGVRR